MKSKILKIRNIAKEPPIIATVSVKPKQGLSILIFVSFIMMIFSNLFSYIGVLVFGISTFCLFVLPDRKLIEFTYDYIILYNCKEREKCSLVYWEDMLTWQYISRADHDELEIELVDHTIKSIECFSRRSVIPLLRTYAREKEKVVIKGKRVKVK